MNKYEKGKIYKLIDNTNGNIYIGSTTQSLANRKSQHKRDTISGRNKCKSKYIIENGDYVMILIENYPCKSKEELLMRERYYIDNTDCINQVRCYISKDERKEYEKEYALKNKDIINEKSKAWYQSNKDKKAEYDKKYREDKKEEKQKYFREHSIYKKTWGGDPRKDNNLLKIDVNLFLY
jgi:hypothetical protein